MTVWACTCTGSTVSRTTHSTSKRDTIGSVRSTFSAKVSEGSYLPPEREQQSHINSLRQTKSQSPFLFQLITAQIYQSFIIIIRADVSNVAEATHLWGWTRR